MNFPITDYPASLWKTRLKPPEVDETVKRRARDTASKTLPQTKGHLEIDQRESGRNLSGQTLRVSQESSFLTPVKGSDITGNNGELSGHRKEQLWARRQSGNNENVKWLSSVKRRRVLEGGEEVSDSEDDEEEEEEEGKGEVLVKNREDLEKMWESMRKGGWTENELQQMKNVFFQSRVKNEFLEQKNNADSKTLGICAEEVNNIPVTEHSPEDNQAKDLEQKEMIDRNGSQEIGNTDPAASF